MEDVLSHINPWTDVEKLIFIDKFLQYPKNFFKVRAVHVRWCVHP